MAPKGFGENGKVGTLARGGAASKGDDAEFRGYVNLNLTEEEKSGYAVWASPDTLFQVFAAQVNGGVNVAVKPDPKGAGFLASATQRRVASPNAGLCVTARADDPVKAFGRLMYILAILDRSPRWEDTQPVANPDRW